MNLIKNKSCHNLQAKGIKDNNNVNFANLCGNGWQGTGEGKSCQPYQDSLWYIDNKTKTAWCIRDPAFPSKNGNC